MESRPRRRKRALAKARCSASEELKPPRSLWAEDSRTGRPFGDVEPTELAVALTARLPLDPGNATQTPPDPAIQRWQFAPLAEAGVPGPTPRERVQVGDHLFQADAPMPPRQFANPIFEPGHGLVGNAPPERRVIRDREAEERPVPRPVATLLSVLICSLRRPSMKRVRLAMSGPVHSAISVSRLASYDLLDLARSSVSGFTGPPGGEQAYRRLPAWPGLSGRHRAYRRSSSRRVVLHRRESAQRPFFWPCQIQRLAQDLSLQDRFAEQPLQLAYLALRGSVLRGWHHLLARTHAEARLRA